MILRLWLEKLRSTFWLVPAVISLAMVVALPLLTRFHVQARWPALEFIVQDLSTSGARQMLASIATSLMTVIGVLFSITVVVLQQVSNQYSPRVIYTYIRSRTSQVVIGFMTGTVIYSLLLMRRISDSIKGTPAHLPQLATATAIVLAVCCFGLIIHYIQYILHSIKSTTIIETITRISLQALDSWEELLQKVSEKESPKNGSFAPSKLQRTSIESYRRGYILAYDWPEINQIMTKLCGKEFWRIESLVKPGDYTQGEVALLHVFSSQELPEEVVASICDCVEIGSERTFSQDIRYGINQLVDVALRALSPGINDPTTAVEALQGIEAILLAWSKKGVHRQRLHFKFGSVSGVGLTSVEIIEESLPQILNASRDKPFLTKKIEDLIYRFKKTDCTHHLYQVARPLLVTDRGVSADL